MKKPDWFILIQQWRLKNMGEYGITLPFLVGAIGYKSGKSKLGAQHVRDVLGDIIERPVVDYITEVRWCSEIDAPVFTVAQNSISNRMPFKSFFSRPNSDEASLVFSDNLQSMLHLNCKDSRECYEKLISYAAQHIEKGHYSRNREDASGKYEYGSFLPKELQYIQETIMET